MLEPYGVALNQNEVGRSDYQVDQFPAYLLPDGTWRFGENARRLAESAWAFRRSFARAESGDQFEYCDL